MAADAQPVANPPTKDAPLSERMQIAPGPTTSGTIERLTEVSRPETSSRPERMNIALPSKMSPAKEERQNVGPELSSISRIERVGP
jgi:hypothetical protein